MSTLKRRASCPVHCKTWPIRWIVGPGISCRLRRPVTKFVMETSRRRSRETSKERFSNCSLQETRRAAVATVPRNVISFHTTFRYVFFQVTLRLNCILRFLTVGRKCAYQSSPGVSRTGAISCCSEHGRIANLFSSRVKKRGLLNRTSNQPEVLP